MVSKSFYHQVIVRILFLTVTSLVIAFTALKLPISFVIIPGLLLVFQIIWLIKSINRSNQKIALFFESIKNEDFSLKFPEDIPDKSFRELNTRINEVNEQIQEIFLANRTQEVYFREVIGQVDVGILSYNKNGHVLFANRTVKKLLGCENLNHIRQLEPLNAELFRLLSADLPFGQKLIEVSNERETIQLSLKSSTFKSPKGPIGLLTVQDIRHELDKKETDSWLKLIRVLTHEIMNTVTPITSITAAILDNFKLDGQIISAEQFDDNRIGNTVKGLEVVKEQGKDLMNFVESYRNFLSVSTPKKEIIKAANLFDTLKILFSKDLQENNIQLRIDIEPPELELFIDRQQIIQVLLNLCKNAIQSIANVGQKNGTLHIFAGTNSVEKKFIQISDNGPGIKPDLIEHIFIPFFTTKRSGSGIGLSLSKQILQLHGGSLRVHSIPFERTSFYLNFNSPWSGEN